MSWLTDYCSNTEQTDRLTDHASHVALLAIGLLGETGSVLAELKKTVRDAEAYPFHRDRLTEEFGDFLWYFARLMTVLAPSMTPKLDEIAARSSSHSAEDPLRPALGLGAAVGGLLRELQREAAGDMASRLSAIWLALLHTSSAARVNLRVAAEKNLEKTRSRWPSRHEYHPLFDEGFDETEQLPRQLRVDFREIRRGGKDVVLLRCNGLNLGDRLTDNIDEPDFYRFHDIFHLANAVYLGWSPVVRFLLNCKRKSDPRVDEDQDGARARIIEEAVSAIVFSRAKQTGFYHGIEQVDYDLLKTVGEFVRGFEVDAVPLWQWEAAILNGYRVFRLLQDHRGGRVTVDLVNRGLHFDAGSGSDHGRVD